MTHEELRELLPLLALDVLTPVERSALTSHLAAGCAACAGELATHRDTAARLAYDAPPVAPPSDLRARVLAACTADPAAAKVARVWRDWEPAPGSVDSDRGFAVVRADQGDWEAVLEGITVKRLSLDLDRRAATMLVRMQAGSEYPGHRHAHAEECLVLDGALRVGDDLILHTGDFQRAESGSVHRRQWTETGCLLLVTSSLDDELD